MSIGDQDYICRVIKPSIINDYKLVYKVASVEHLTETIKAMPAEEIKNAIIDFLNEDNVNNIETEFLHIINMKILEKWGKENKIPKTSIYAQPNKSKEPEKPKQPLCRLIREGSIGDCPDCGSTTVRKYWIFGKKIGCIQPKCKNYYKNKE